MAKVQSGSGMIEDREEELYQRAETARDVKEAINQAMIERYSVIEQKKKESERVELDRNLSETERMRRVNAEREEKEDEDNRDYDDINQFIRLFFPLSSCVSSGRACISLPQQDTGL